MADDWVPPGAVEVQAVPVKAHTRFRPIRAAASQTDTWVPPGAVEQNTPNWSGMAASHVSTTVPDWLRNGIASMSQFTGMRGQDPAAMQGFLGGAANALPAVATTAAAIGTGGNPAIVGTVGAGATGLRDQARTALGLDDQRSLGREAANMGTAGALFGGMQGLSNVAAPLAENVGARLWQGAVGKIPAAVLKRFPVPQHLLDQGVSPREYYAALFAEQALPLGNPSRGAFRANVKNAAAEADALVQNANPGQFPTSAAKIARMAKSGADVGQLRFGEDPAGDIEQVHAVIDNWAAQHPEGLQLPELNAMKQQMAARIQGMYATAQEGGSRAVAASPAMRKVAVKSLADGIRAYLEDTIAGLEAANQNTRNMMALRAIASKRADVTAPPFSIAKNPLGPAGAPLWQILQSPAALSRYGMFLQNPALQDVLARIPQAVSAGGSLFTAPPNNGGNGQ